MINFQVFGICNLLKLLMAEEQDFIQRRDSATEPNYAKRLTVFLDGHENTHIGFADSDRINALLQMATLVVVEMEMTASAHRIRLFTKRLRSNISVTDYLAETRALRESIEGELRQQYFYRYPSNKIHVVREVESDWKAVIDRFPLSKVEVISAADCYAIGHGTACVFHLMRIAEYGLRALARERRIKLGKRRLEWAEWRQIIDGIKRTVDPLVNKSPGPARDAALEFYRGAIASFEGFKDAYRNNVMHSRKSYSDIEALMLMRHVHTFMDRLASKIDENGKPRIKWGLR
jgi:hypothetical protein